MCFLPHSPGYLVDVYHKYEYLFIMCGSVILSGGVFSLLMNLCHFHALRKDEERKKANDVPSDVEKRASVEPIPEAAAEEAKEATRLETGTDASKDV